MEPLSITVACVSLLSGVAKLSIQAKDFVASVRDARKDMISVQAELRSLSICLETLRDDSMTTVYPDAFRENLLTVLKHCGTVTTQMTVLLDKYSSINVLRRIQWSASGRDEMNQLRSSLESHKSALGIGLDMTSLYVLSFYGIKACVICCCLIKRSHHCYADYIGQRPNTFCLSPESMS